MKPTKLQSARADAALVKVADPLIGRFLHIVEEVADNLLRRYPRLDRDQLVSDGQLELMNVVTKPQCTGDRNPSGFVAHCLRQAMLTGIRQTDPLRKVKLHGEPVPVLYSMDMPTGDTDRTLAEIIPDEPDARDVDAEATGFEAVKLLSESLPADLQRIVHMEFIEGMTVADVAAALNTTTAHIERQRGAALAALHQEIGAGEFPVVEETIMRINQARKMNVAAMRPVDDADCERFRDVPTPDLKEMLRQKLEQTAQSIRELAAIVRELQRRGEGLQDVNDIGLIYYLAKIAAGKLIPEALAAFAGNIRLLERMVDMPLAAQVRLVNNEPIQFLTRKGDGFTPVMVEPGTMSKHQIEQLLTKTGIRTPAEQKQYLMRPAPLRPAPAAQYVVDPVKQVVLVNPIKGGVTFTTHDLIKLLGEMMQPAQQKGGANAA